MSKTYFISNTAEGKAANFEQFRDNIPKYVTLFGLDPADITQQAGDATYYRQLLTFSKTMSAVGPQWTSWKTTVLTGASGTEPALPVKPAGFPAPVAPGILTRFTTLARMVKNHKNYTPEIGTILGLEGAEQGGPDLDTVQPDFNAVVTTSVFLNWDWAGNGAWLDMLKIEVDRGDGKGFTTLATDTTPGYTDSTPFPAAPAKWTYRAIYIVGDAPVGLWSKNVVVNVGG